MHLLKMIFTLPGLDNTNSNIFTHIHKTKKLGLSKLLLFRGRRKVLDDASLAGLGQGILQLVQLGCTRLGDWPET